MKRPFPHARKNHSRLNFVFSVWNFHSRLKFSIRGLFCGQRGARNEKTILDWKFHSVLKAWFFQYCLSRLNFVYRLALWVWIFAVRGVLADFHDFNLSELQTHPNLHSPVWVGSKGGRPPARGYKFGCVCSCIAGHYPSILMTGDIGTNTPKFVPPRWGRPPFDPTQTGLCKFGWVWSSTILTLLWTSGLLRDWHCCDVVHSGQQWSSRLLRSIMQLTRGTTGPRARITSDLTMGIDSS